MAITAAGRPRLRGALMVCGTTSDAGKSTVVTALCRVLGRQGVRVAPFKAQNMALNSAVTRSGHEISRAQYLQAQAAGVEPEVAMNPVLLKPTGERSSQVVVNGRPVGELSAAEYHRRKPELFDLVLDAVTDLRSRFDVVLAEGAGSPTEINLLPHDIVNLRLAQRAGLPAVVVGDIDRGGVFAALHGTVDLLPPELAALVKGFVVNRFRGDPALLLDGFAQLERACGVPTLGVLPFLDGLRLDAEDSLALDTPEEHRPDATLDVAVIRLPHISNFTDLDPLRCEPEVALRYVRSARELGRPDLVVLPGTKATVADLTWLRRRGLDTAISRVAAGGATTVLGICGGYQMLGRWIDDEVESRQGRTPGLGLLAVTTAFGPDKVLARRRGVAFDRHDVDGYQIHHGRVRPDGRGEVWLTLDGEPEGVADGCVLGTTLHGLLEADRFRAAFLHRVAGRAGVTVAVAGGCFGRAREAALDRLGDAVEQHLDLDRVLAIIEEAA
jgi:adenosylcobyric acid synthase